jgi:hypothetical protein
MLLLCPATATLPVSSWTNAGLSRSKFVGFFSDYRLLQYDRPQSSWLRSNLVSERGIRPLGRHEARERIFGQDYAKALATWRNNFRKAPLIARQASVGKHRHAPDGVCEIEITAGAAALRSQSASTRVVARFQHAGRTPSHEHQQ